MNRQNRVVSRIMMVDALALLVAAPGAVAEDELPLDIHANVIRASGAGQGHGGMLQVTIDRWTTDEEGQTVYDAIKTGDQQKIEKAMQDLESAGSANLACHMGLHLLVALMFVTQEGGTEIILATDRPISVREEMAGGQSTKFNTSLIVLQIPASGDGAGMYASAVELSIGDGGKIEPNTLGQGVTKLGHVKVVEKKHKKD